MCVCVCVCARAVCGGGMTRMLKALHQAHQQIPCLAHQHISASTEVLHLNHAHLVCEFENLFLQIQIDT